MNYPFLILENKKYFNFILFKTYKKRPLPQRAAVFEVYVSKTKVYALPDFAENTSSPEALLQRG